MGWEMLSSLSDNPESHRLPTSWAPKVPAEGRPLERQEKVTASWQEASGAGLAALRTAAGLPTLHGHPQPVVGRRQLPISI